MASDSEAQSELQISEFSKLPIWSCPCAREVQTLWQWVSWLRRCCVCAGKIPVLLNETYVPWNPGYVAGNVVRKPKRVQGACASKQRKGRFSFTPVICTDEALQPMLPRFIVAKRSVLSARAVRNTDKPDSVHVWREASAWSTVRIMCRMLEELSRALAPFPNYQAILLLDCHSSHLHPETVRAANNHGLSMAVIPAGLTGLVQPLDTLAFAGFKCRLKQQFQIGLGERQTMPEDQSFFNGKRWQPGFAPLEFEPQFPIRLARELRVYQEALALVPSIAPTRDELLSSQLSVDRRSF